MFCLHSAAAIVAALPSWHKPNHGQRLRICLRCMWMVSHVDTHTFSADAVLWTASGGQPLQQRQTTRLAVG